MHDVVRVLLDALDTFYADFQDGISEYALLKKLQAPPWQLFNDADLQQSLSLFQCHFLLFHALYLLRDDLRVRQIGELDIHTTAIKLLPLNVNQAGLVTDDPLRDYYLDFTHWEATQQDEVDRLLDTFWQHYLRGGPLPDASQIGDAQRVLEWPEDVTLERAAVKKQYRRLQHRCHPDKGGSTEDAQALSAAYQTLLSACIN